MKKPKPLTMFCLITAATSLSFMLDRGPLLEHWAVGLLFGWCLWQGAWLSDRLDMFGRQARLAAQHRSLTLKLEAAESRADWEAVKREELWRLRRAHLAAMHSQLCVGQVDEIIRHLEHELAATAPQVN